MILTATGKQAKTTTATTIATTITKDKRNKEINNKKKVIYICIYI